MTYSILYTPTRGVWVIPVSIYKVIIMASEIKHTMEENVQVSQTRTMAMEESQATLALEGMPCASCAVRIEKGLKKIPGVKDASVNFATEQATVTYEPAQTNLEQMVQKVEAIGYKATSRVASSLKPAQGTAASGVSETLDTHVISVAQEDEQSRRKQAEIVRKRNLRALRLGLTPPLSTLSILLIHLFPVPTYL